MNEKLVKDAANCLISAESLLSEIAKFVETNIVKVDVKVTEGPLLKETRKVIAEGLRKIAIAVEDPSAKITWVDVKKDKPAKK